MENFESQLTFSRFYEICRRYPGNTALIYLGKRFSYSLLERMVDQFARGLSALGIKKGDKVTKGQTIGEMGSTGWSTGPHLHFEVIRNGENANPLSVLPR